MPESKTPFLIAVDARPLSTNMSGVGRVIHETIRAFPDKVNYRFLLFTHRPIHSSHSALLGLPNVVVYQGKGLLASRGAIYFNIYLPYIIRRIPIDLFWGSQQFIPPLLPKKIRVVLTFYDLVLYFFPGTMRKIAAFQQQLFQNLSVSRADFILSISKQTRDDMIRRFHYDKKKTGIAYPAVDFHQIKMLMKQKPTKRITSIKAPYILSVSTIEPRKNYPFLLKVYREYRILNKKKHWKWVIAGKIGWENPLFIDELKKEIEDFGDIIHIDSPTDIE
ncbi:MAG: glycosyltransferase, partial [Leptospira sp.]|nr:glycosyltransferase [Leptospira sp.]